MERIQIVTFSQSQAVPTMPPAPPKTFEWSYLDPQGMQQGPFQPDEMFEWWEILHIFWHRNHLLIVEQLLTWDAPTVESFPQNGKDGISNPFQLGKFHPPVNLESGQQHFLNISGMQFSPRPMSMSIDSCFHAQCQQPIVSMPMSTSMLSSSCSVLTKISFNVNFDVQAHCWLLPCRSDGEKGLRSEVRF